MQIYPQSRLIKIDAYSAVTSWALMALASGLLLLVMVLELRMFGAIVAGAAFLLAGLTHTGFALAHKCPHCGKHPTIQGFAPLHPDIPTKGLDGWARVVVDVVKRREFACIHCGTRYRVSDDA